MEPPWNLHGTWWFHGGFMEFPWRFHGGSMEIPWMFHGWNLHGTSMDWNLHGTCIKHTYNVGPLSNRCREQLKKQNENSIRLIDNEFYNNFYRNLHQTSMEPPWNLHGTSMEPPWNLQIWWRFHGGSMEVPWRFHGGSINFWSKFL